MKNFLRLKNVKGEKNFLELENFILGTSGSLRFRKGSATSEIILSTKWSAHHGERSFCPALFAHRIQRNLNK